MTFCDGYAQSSSRLAELLFLEEGEAHAPMQCRHGVGSALQGAPPPRKEGDAV